MFIDFVDIVPIKALFWSVVINGGVALPLRQWVTGMAQERSVMGSFIVPRPLCF